MKMRIDTNFNNENLYRYYFSRRCVSIQILKMKMCIDISENTYRYEFPEMKHTTLRRKINISENTYRYAFSEVIDTALPRKFDILESIPQNE